jgi:hypothetical protein
MVFCMASTLTAARPRSAQRSPVRPKASAHRQGTRLPQPRIPQDFFAPADYALLTDLLITRAAHWQAEGAPPIFYYGRDSEPIWGDFASHRCSGTTLRIAGLSILYDSFCLELERGLRLLTLTWQDARTTQEGQPCEAWRVALAGVFWRVGQLYREVTRRKGVEQAREVLRLAINTLHW